MKTHKIFYSVFFAMLFTASTNAQIGIGTTTIDGEGLLAFAENLGIVLPWVETPRITDTNGTLVFDTQTNKIRVKADGTWRDLSRSMGELDTSKTTMVSDHLAKTESTNTNGVVIGSTTPTAPGVLVLESNDKAMILPKMASPHLNMSNPEPGTMVYDTVSKKMCVFNGSSWSFWGI